MRVIVVALVAANKCWKKVTADKNTLFSVVSKLETKFYTGFC